MTDKFCLTGCYDSEIHGVDFLGRGTGLIIRPTYNKINLFKKLIFLLKSFDIINEYPKIEWN
jgi:hypothetical protein